MFPWNKHFPFNNQSGQLPETFRNMNPKNVEDYIQSVMGNVFGEGFSQQFPYQGNLTAKEKQPQGNPANAELFETNDNIFVKLPATDDQAGNLRIQHNSNQLFIINYPAVGEQKKFILPCLVKRKGTKASYRNGILEIKLMKNEDLQLSEIDIINRGE